LSKDPEDKDEPPAAKWGEHVRGVDQGDGWLKVGHRFLPMLVKGKPVLACKEQTFLVDNSLLKQRGDGIRYRLSKDPEDKDGPPAAQWGEYVQGGDEGDGWVRVGNRYLPAEVKGKRVLKPEGGAPVQSKPKAKKGSAAGRRETASRANQSAEARGPPPSLEKDMSRYESDDEDSSDDDRMPRLAGPPVGEAALAPASFLAAAAAGAAAELAETSAKVAPEADSSGDEHVVLDGAHLGGGSVSGASKSAAGLRVGGRLLVGRARPLEEGGNAVRTLAKYALSLLAKARAHREGMTMG